MYLFPMITAGTFRFIYNLYARAYRHYRRIFAAPVLFLFSIHLPDSRIAVDAGQK